MKTQGMKRKDMSLHLHPGTSRQGMSIHLYPGTKPRRGRNPLRGTSERPGLIMKQLRHAFWNFRGTG